MRRFTGLLLLIGLLSGSLGILSAQGLDSTKNAPAARNLAEAIPFSADVKAGVLPNGFSYFIRANKVPEKRAYLYLAVKAGSLFETDEQQGLAHFLEHMAFNGTKNFPEKAILDYLQSIGMGFGPEVNAYTSYDRTVYTLEIPTDNAQALEKGVKILDEWSRNVSLDPVEIENEKPVIYEEYRSRKGADDRIREKQLPLIFGQQRYIDRKPIGKPEIFLQADQKKLRTFYETWYKPDSMALIAVGDFDPAVLETLVKANFTAKKPDAPTVLPQYPLARVEKGRIQISRETDPELASANLRVLYRLKDEPEPRTLADYRASLVASLAGGMISNQLQELANDPSAPFLRAGAGRSGLSGDSKIFLFFASPKPGLSGPSLDALLELKERVKRFGFSAEELAAQKDEYVNYFETLAQEADKTESSSLVEELTRHFLEGEIVPGIRWEFETTKALAETISLEEVNAVARSFFEDEDVTVLLAGPESEAGSLPEEKALREKVVQVLGKELNAVASGPQQRDILAETRALLPKPGKILEESYDKVNDLTLLTLENGAKVYIKKTAYKNDEIVLNALALGGETLAQDADYYSARYASSLAAYSGLGPYSKTELENSLRGKTARLSLSVDTYTQSLNGVSNGKDLELLFALLYLRFANPKIDDQAAKAFLDTLRLSLLNQDNDPDAVFGQRLGEILAGNHPRAKKLDEAAIASVSTEKALAFLKKVFNAGDFQFTFVGNVDVAVLKGLVEKYLASIPQKRQGLAWKDLGMNQPETFDEKIFKGKDDRSQVYLSWQVPDAYEYRKFIQTRVLGEIIDMRFTSEIREKRGGVYSISKGLAYRTIPRENLSLAVYFVSSPDRVEELDKAVADELAAIRDKGVTASELAKAKEIVKKTWESDIQDNATWASLINQLLLVRKRPVSSVNNFAQMVDEVSSKDVSVLVSKVFSPKKVRLVLFPEAQNKQ